MRYDQSERGYVETEKFEVKISKPRGMWKDYHLEVVAKVKHAGVSVIQAELTNDVVEMLHGSGDGVSTSASVWGLIEEAAEDYPELDLGAIKSETVKYP